jgi:glyoxylase-like metal-dependent hydrolase (beta-lactamase superfamily II)
MQRVIPNVYNLSNMLVGRVYVIRDPDGLTIIDTSIPGKAGAILDQITAHGGRPENVKRILITHAHPDHIGSLRELQARTGAQVWASAGERAVIAERAEIPRVPVADLPAHLRPFRTPSVRFDPTPVHRVLQEGETLAEVLGGLQVVATPGHAPGHIAFWQPDQGILFCGDVMMHLQPNLHLPFRIATVDMAENLRSLGRVATLDAEVLCLGHGEPLVRKTAAAVRALAARVGAA